MKSNLNAHSGNALIAASILSVTTMVLHPSGGSIEHIRHMIPMIVVTHSIALVALPLFLSGFWGLTKLLSTRIYLARLGFCFMAIGLISVMCAATLNGLALPLFLQKFKDVPPGELPMVYMIFRYNLILNQAFDFVFIGAAICATATLSLAIILSQALPKWIGCLGLIFTFTALLPVFPALSMVHLTGFRLFILGFTIWTLIVAVYIRKISD